MNSCRTRFVESLNNPVCTAGLIHMQLPEGLTLESKRQLAQELFERFPKITCQYEYREGVYVFPSSYYSADMSDEKMRYVNVFYLI